VTSIQYPVSPFFLATANWQLLTDLEWVCFPESIRLFEWKSLK